MKGKKILALASIFAGVALVGTTFADWVVTDNAASKTIKISGEKIQGDTDTRSFVTLSYGEHTAINDVANLAANTTRYAGCVGLVATYTGAESYNGLLTATMSQASTRTGDNLIDYLKVEVLDKAPTYDNSTKIISAKASGTTTHIALDGTAQTPVLSGSKSISVTTGSEEKVYIAVQLVEATADASILNTIKSDVVSLVLDWNHDTTGQTIASGTTVYYKPSGAKSGEVYCYAWKGKNANASEFPGVAMTLDSETGLYSYTISNSYESFILSYNDNDGVNHQTDDMATSEVVGNNNYWNGTAWTTKPAADPSLTKDYYVVGTFNSWTCNDTYGMTKVGETAEYKLEGLVLTAGAKLKVRTSTNAAEEHWYSSVSPWDNCGFTVDDEGNVVVSAAGTYTVHFWSTAENNNYISLTKTA